MLSTLFYPPTGVPRPCSQRNIFADSSSSGVAVSPFPSNYGEINENSPSLSITSAKNINIGNFSRFPFSTFSRISTIRGEISNTPGFFPTPENNVCPPRQRRRRRQQLFFFTLRFAL